MQQSFWAVTLYPSVSAYRTSEAWAKTFGPTKRERRALPCKQQGSFRWVNVKILSGKHRIISWGWPRDFSYHLADSKDAVFMSIFCPAKSYHENKLQLICKAMQTAAEALIQAAGEIWIKMQHCELWRCCWRYWKLEQLWIICDPPENKKRNNHSLAIPIYRKYPSPYFLN